jgi:hypothetical protein
LDWQASFQGLKKNLALGEPTTPTLVRADRMNKLDTCIGNQPADEWLNRLKVDEG